MDGSKTKQIFWILVILPLGLIGYGLRGTQADDTGWRSPSLSITGGQFNNPDNAFSSDNNYATESTDNEKQRYANFGFSIPAGSTIDGMEARVEAKSSDNTGNRKFIVDLSWNGGSNFSAVRQITLSPTESYYTRGSSVDKWGSHSWSVSDFSDANFQVRVKSDISGGNVLSLDHLQIKVYYTPPVTTTTTSTTLASSTTTTSTTTTSTTTTTVPTIVTLINFTAEADDDGKVTLTWETASEINNAGFNIYRARRKSGNYIQLNNATIDPRGDETYGASYSFVDTPPGPGTYYYKLEDIDYSGARTIHGPVRVRAGESEAKGR